MSPELPTFKDFTLNGILAPQNAPAAQPAPVAVQFSAPAAQTAHNPYIAPLGGVNPYAETKKGYKELSPETEFELEQRLILEKAIENGELIPDFNRKFARYILNQPPPENLVFVGKIDGMGGVRKKKGAAEAGEIAHIPWDVMTHLLDSVFDSWSIEAKYQAVEAVKNDGFAKKLTLCVVTLTVVYPLSETVRKFSGAAESNFLQQTAGAALMAMAAKNAVKKIGRFFGRDLFSDLDVLDSIETPKVSFSDEINK